MSNELLPCPFCGGAIEKQKGFSGITFFTCDFCGLTASFRDEKGVSIESEDVDFAWNRRAQQAVPAGYALVPIEPTEAMLDAGYSLQYPTVDEIYDVMIAKAQAEI